MSLTANLLAPTTPRMGRTKINDEIVTPRLPEGTKARIEAVRGEQTQAEFLRETILNEIKRRERAARKANPTPSSTQP